METPLLNYALEVCDEQHPMQEPCPRWSDVYLLLCDTYYGEVD